MTSDEKVDYVQVDKEKTQALQNTMQEWTDVRQSTEPAKGVKSWHWPTHQKQALKCPYYAGLSFYSGSQLK